MSEEKKAKVIASIRMDIYDDGNIVTRPKCDKNYEQSFALLLTAMQQGTAQELILKKMVENASTKEQAGIIAIYYNEMVKQIVATIQKQYEQNEPVIDPTHMFSRQMAKTRKAK